MSQGKTLPVSVDKRRAPRFRRFQLALYRTPSVRGEGHLAELSRVGLFIRCDVLPVMREPVWILAADPHPRLLVVGKVRSVDASGKRRGFGLEIQQMCSGYERIIAELEGLRLRP